MMKRKISAKKTSQFISKSSRVAQFFLGVFFLLLLFGQDASLAGQEYFAQIGFLLGFLLFLGLKLMVWLINLQIGWFGWFKIKLANQDDVNLIRASLLVVMLIIYPIFLMQMGYEAGWSWQQLLTQSRQWGQLALFSSLLYPMFEFADYLEAERKNLWPLIVYVGGVGLYVLTVLPGFLLVAYGVSGLMKRWWQIKKSKPVLKP